MKGNIFVKMLKDSELRRSQSAKNARVVIAHYHCPILSLAYL